MTDCKYHWPGNISNIIVKTLHLSGNHKETVEHSDQEQVVNISGEKMWQQASNAAGGKWKHQRI